MTNTQEKTASVVIGIIGVAVSITGIVYTLPVLYRAFFQPVFHSAEPTTHQWLGIWATAYFLQDNRTADSDKKEDPLNRALAAFAATCFKLLFAWCFIWLFR